MKIPPHLQSPRIQVVHLSYETAGGGPGYIVQTRRRLGGGPFSKVDPRKFTLIQGSIF